eukprot:tig00000137_g8139.t1
MAPRKAPADKDAPKRRLSEAEAADAGKPAAKKSEAAPKKRKQEAKPATAKEAPKEPEAAVAAGKDAKAGKGKKEKKEKPAAAPAKPATPEAAPAPATKKRARAEEPEKAPARAPAKGKKGEASPPKKHKPESPAPAEKAAAKAKGGKAGKAGKAGGGAGEGKAAAAGKGKGKRRQAADEEDEDVIQLPADSDEEEEGEVGAVFEGDDGAGSDAEPEAAAGPSVLLSDAKRAELEARVAALPAKKKKAKSKKRKGGEEDGEEDGEPGVVYLGHIPYGFFEDQMRGFFAQFGRVTRLRLSRSKKTGKSRGFAFVEFASAEVARIVAETMDKYLLFGRLLTAKLVPPERVHPKTFVGANRKFKRVRPAPPSPAQPRPLSRKGRSLFASSGRRDETGFPFVTHLLNEPIPQLTLIPAFHSFPLSNFSGRVMKLDSPS